MKKSKYIIGIDEVGRGPLAGPVTIGIVKVPVDYIFLIFPKLRDSKKLSEIQRENIFKIAMKEKRKEKISFLILSFKAEKIDKIGISKCIKKMIENGLKKIASKEDQIFLDGSLYAPLLYKNQKTIIKGDDKIPVISLASVLAKVSRDRFMKKMSKLYPKYGFEKHKGYGTLYHRNCIHRLGITKLHRVSYLKKVAKSE
jgi:ribonuclease HII